MGAQLKPVDSVLHTDVPNLTNLECPRRLLTIHFEPDIRPCALTEHSRINQRSFNMQMLHGDGATQVAQLICKAQS